MAAELTARGITTPNNAKWHAQTVILNVPRIWSSDLSMSASRVAQLMDDVFDHLVGQATGFARLDEMAAGNRVVGGPRTT
jgi:hypothetical protein